MRILCVGLPGTGKTTFVVALWHILETRLAQGSLVLSRVEGDQEHLETLRELWMSREPLPRTSSDSERHLTFTVSERRSTASATIHIPDLAGETYRHHWVYRHWTESFAELALGADAVLLFVNPVAHIEAVPIAEAIDEHVAAIIDAPGPGEQLAQAAQTEESSSPWSAEETPSDIQLVEILQFLIARRGSENALPVAIVVSAWDVAQREGLAPSGWLARHAPLLQQYLRSNPGEFRYSCFGVSAQGGDLRTQQAELLAATDPADTVVVTDGVLSNQDLSRPIRWLMATFG